MGNPDSGRAEIQQWVNVEEVREHRQEQKRHAAPEKGLAQT